MWHAQGRGQTHAMLQLENLTERGTLKTQAKLEG
jgi:hypothetical protein